jgi:hypothetical protein
MLDGRIDVEADLIGVHHLPEDLPIKLVEGFVVRALHLDVDSKTHATDLLS